MKNVIKVFIALLAVVLMPILIWVAFGVALNIKLRQPKKVSVPSIGEILEKAKS